VGLAATEELEVVEVDVDARDVELLGGELVF